MQGHERDIRLGIDDLYVHKGDHIAYFWETEAEFAEAVGVLVVGLRGGEHCVIFGHQEANDRVCAVLRGHGYDCEALQEAGRLTLVGGNQVADEMLANLGAVFQRALERGAPLIRLLGNIGWGHQGWPSEADILAFEAKVTGAALSFPSVVVCMYDVRALPGHVVLHGAFETHPWTVCRNIIRENPHYVPLEDFLARLTSEGGK